MKCSFLVKNKSTVLLLKLGGDVANTSKVFINNCLIDSTQKELTRQRYGGSRRPQKKPCFEARDGICLKIRCL